MTRQYEAIVIFPSSFPGEKLEEVKKSFNDQVQKQGGTVTSVHETGRKSFGYVIKKQREGIYYVFDFTLDPAKVSDLRRTLTLTDGILRASILIKENFPAPKPLAPQTSSAPSGRPSRPYTPRTSDAR